MRFPTSPALRATCLLAAAAGMALPGCGDGNHATSGSSNQPAAALACDDGLKTETPRV